MALPSIGYRSAPPLASAPLALPVVMAAVTALFGLAAGFGADSYVVGEIDVAWMIAGVVHGTLAHAPFTGPLHYGETFSFGYYALLYLLPAQVRADPAALARAVNLIGLISITAALPLAWRYLARLMDEQAAAFAVAVFFFSPLVLHVSGSGHPLLLAFALALAAALALERLPLAGIALMTAALAVRAEIALLLPFFALTEPALVRRSLQLGAALVLCFALQRLFVPPAQAGPGTILAFISAYYDWRLLPRGAAMIVLGAGFATCAAAALTLLARGGAPLGRRGGVALTALLLPSLLAWLPNPQPARHFFIVVLGIALFLAWRVSAAVANRRVLALVAVGLIVANQALAEAAYPFIVRSYDWAHPASDARRSVYWAPLGTFLRDAPARRREQEALYAEALHVVEAARDVPRLLVLAHNDRYLVARFIADDPTLKPRVVERGGVSYQELVSPSRRIAIARLWSREPRASAIALLQAGEFAGWPVYAQPASVGVLPASALAGYTPLLGRTD
jgi:hypothetical protein